MNRMVACCWYVFKLALLPIAIVLSVALPNQSLTELFSNFSYIANGLFNDSPYTAWFTSALAAPVALLTWLMPSAMTGAMWILAAIFGQFGFWVLLVLLCASISAPRSLGIEESGSKLIPFRRAVISMVALAVISVAYDASRVNFFDDSYAGHLVVGGKVTSVPAKVIFEPGRYGKQPRVMISVEGDREALGFRDSYSYFVNNNPHGVWCRIDDYSAWPDGRYYVDMRSGSIPSCKQAVMTPSGFDGMTLEVNRGLPGAFAVQVERQYRHNPLVTALQYLQFKNGGFVKL